MKQLLIKIWNNYYNYLKDTPVGKQELDNFKLSLLFSLILGFILVAGVDDNGNFRHSILSDLAGFLLSENGIYIAFFASPIVFWTLLKMALFDVETPPWANVFAQFLTGVLYSFGCGILVFFAASLYYGYGFNWAFLSFGIATNFLGWALYIFLQIAIQRTSTPES